MKTRISARSVSGIALVMAAGWLTLASSGCNPNKSSDYPDRPPVDREIIDRNTMPKRNDMPGMPGQRPGRLASPRSDYPEVKTLPENESDTDYYSLYDARASGARAGRGAGGAGQKISPSDTSNAPGSPNTSPGNRDGDAFGSGAVPLNLRNGRPQ